MKHRFFAKAWRWRLLLLACLVLTVGGIVWRPAVLSEQNATAGEPFKTVAPDRAQQKGCLSCHEGIEVINEKMQPFLLAMGGNREGYECVVCHEGKADATTKKDGHAGMYPNPSSMWVLNAGKGCAKCHSDENALKTLMGQPKDEPAGGSLMSVVSTATDPSGASGSNHVYRLERSLMSLETGKVNKTLMSNGVIPKGEWRYANFDMDDPDGPVPAAGSAEYKEWIAKALESDLIQIMDHTEEVPTLEEGIEIWGDESKAAFSDMHRKECGRCHVWGEGRSKRGDHRAGGCAACHVLYNNDGLSESGDPTISKGEERAHPMKHQITVEVPPQQCNHCHTRGRRIGTTYAGLFEHQYIGSGETAPFDPAGEPQTPLYTKEYNHVREDLHGERGMQCADCHTSIAMHGDGNIYPVTYYQVEVGCADCHGTPDQYPWELPVGYGTPVETKARRGVYKANETEYLITTRGNPRTRWIKEGDRAFIIGVADGSRREIPLLKNKALHNNWKTEQGKTAMSVVSQHLEKLECYACHATWSPQCYGCHIKYDANKEGTDWVGSALNHDALGKQVTTTAPGDIDTENVSYMRWEQPLLGVNYKGRVSPVSPGCQVVWSYVDKNGVLREVNKINTTSDGLRAPTLAPLQPHSVTAVARTCESCHTDPKALGYGVGKSRSAAKVEGDRPLFGLMGEDVNADIPSSEKAEPQIPGIPDFPYAWDQLVTRSGEQVQNMPLRVDRPLDEAERNKAEREGSCIACHKHYNTSTWDNIRAKLHDMLGIAGGRALTPEEHDKAVEAALLSLVGE